MTTHVEDGALIRFLDHEDDGAERAVVATHLGDCDRCAARLAGLSRTAVALTAALEAADSPAPRARSRLGPRWTLRAAAAVLVLLGVGGVVRPVRAWILDRAGALWEAVTGREETAAGQPPAAVAPSASVSFVPAGPEFTLEVTTTQQGGVLQVETIPGDTAVAVVRDGTGAEDLVVLPSTLRIVNARTSTASYLIRVPARLARVTVRVGDGAPWNYRPAGAPREIDLRNR